MGPLGTHRHLLPLLFAAWAPLETVPGSRGTDTTAVHHFQVLSWKKNNSKNRRRRRQKAGKTQVIPQVGGRDPK
jgi:hypothetical protein